ncbi:MAG TPA: FHA domain-containing protein, partial [Steroidobacteraceae bacterium]|nr:FHA domain-containing protein [Steroidobacteraceae bacterium]
FKMKKAGLIATLNGFLIEQYSAGRRVLLIVDEAQNLSNKVLEEIRLLSGVETTKDKVLRIILAGQPELNDKLNSPEMIQLAQRIRLRFHLTPLSKTDMQSYIEHRLEVAGSHGREIFDVNTFPLIFRYTGGVPRLINTLCDTAMLSAYGQDRDKVTVADVESAIEELRWVEYAERSVRLPALNVDTSGERRMVLGRVLLALGGKTLAERELKLGRFIIGRTEENDLPIDSKYISRHHAQIVTTLNTSILEDLNSTNGVYVRQKRVRRRILNDGDVIRIGEHEIMYIDERQVQSKLSKNNIEDDAVPLLDQTMINDVAVPMEPANAPEPTT